MPKLIASKSCESRKGKDQRIRADRRRTSLVNVQTSGKKPTKEQEKVSGAMRSETFDNPPLEAASANKQRLADVE